MKKRILIVDSNKHLSFELGKNIIKYFDCSVVRIFDGYSAVQTLSNEEFDLLITEIMLNLTQSCEFGCDNCLAQIETGKDFLAKTIDIDFFNTMNLGMGIIDWIRKNKNNIPIIALSQRGAEVSLRQSMIKLEVIALLCKDIMLDNFNNPLFQEIEKIIPRKEIESN